MPSRSAMTLQQYSGSKIGTPPVPADDAREFVCGLGAASINILATFPINKIIFRQQLLGITTQSALKELQAEGIVTLYRGILPPMIQKNFTLSFMFGMYDKFNKLFGQNYPAVSPILQKSAAAVLAGCCEAVFTPFERVQTLLQDRYYQQHFRNTFHAFRVLQPWGYQEFYRGLVPILLRNGPSNALFFLFRGEVKDLLPKSDHQSVEVLRNFVSGAVLGAVISTIFYPLNVIKIQMQSKVGGPFMTSLEAFLIVYNERNHSLAAVFHGARVNYIRALISWGIINASYELLKTLLYNNHYDT